MLTLLAYVDPGSTAFLFQAAVGAAMGASLVVKRYWRRWFGGDRD